MKELKFKYEMKLRFTEPVREHYFALRCLPVSHQNQRILELNWSINPTTKISEVTDGFGNRKVTGCCRLPHREFSCLVEGMARVEGMCVQREELHPMYRYTSAYTKWGRALEELSERIGTLRGSHLEQAIALMEYVYTQMEYCPGVTQITTTAEEAAEKMCGVCQDYAHIFIALLRHRGIPARYVNGFMIGEGASHAWVEVYTGEGWYGLDVTNNLHVDDYYIKLAHGRDYQDCVLEKGMFLGAARQQQEIHVSVEEMEG